MTIDLKTEKTYCSGSDLDAGNLERRRVSGSTFVECPECQRKLKPTPAGNKLRRHQPRNKATASLDDTRDRLWSYAQRISGEHSHFALGLSVQIRFGAKPTGWDEDEPFVGNGTDGWDDYDYDRWHSISEVGSDGSFEVAGWYWEPTDLVVPR